MCLCRIVCDPGTSIMRQSRSELLCCATQKERKPKENILLANYVSFALKVENVIIPKRRYLFTKTRSNRTENSVVRIMFNFSREVLIQVRQFYSSNRKFSAAAKLLKLLRCQTNQMPTRTQRQRDWVELVGLLISMPRKRMITQTGNCTHLQN